MPLFENLDFLNANTLRNFPIREGLDKLDISGVLTIPDALIVDASLAVSSDPELSIYISRITNSPTEIELEVAVVSSAEVVGTFVIDVISHERYQTYYLVPGSGSANATGKLVIAEVEPMLLLPFGSFTFAATSTELEARTVIPSLVTISRLTFKNADLSTFSVSGDVTLVAQSNLKFRLISATEVALDAGDGLGLNETCDDERPCIKTINQITPDVAGNFWITTSDCATITAISGGLNLADSCCKPCLSCNEIGDLTARLMQLEDDLITIRNHYNEVSLLTTQLGTLSTANCDC